MMILLAQPEVKHDGLLTCPQLIYHTVESRGSVMQIISLTYTLLLVSLYANWLLPFLQYSTS